jgi:hypothetical protein
MDAAIAIGGLILLAGISIWIAVAEAKSHATQREAAKAMKEVIDATKRFEQARRDSAGLPRRERIILMLQELRASGGTAVPTDEREDAARDAGPL